MTAVAQLGIFFLPFFFFRLPRVPGGLTLVARHYSFDFRIFTKKKEEAKTEKENGEVSSGNTIIYGVIIFIELNSLRLQLKGMIRR